ncbi:SigE family RNA polymerase sigma factor [Nocardioides cynanchi]|uniref:SigE family RNA polymerase sigma factor n=1 Tax=Nocardioides cynanchi TaxID=2558918 RepID=UPI0012442984|nr:SigE family RNA polymerase sigma factor [Nocardioides cynanchi]
MITERREQRAFEAFVADASGRLMRTAYLLCGDRGHAEDLVQTALFRTARRWHRARQQPEAYARRVVVNLAKDRWRSLGRRPGEVGVDLETLEALDTRATHDEGLLERVRLLDAIRRLPSGQQAVLTLRFLADLSVAETAATLDCSEGNVKSQTARALDRIRDVLDHEKENADADR